MMNDHVVCPVCGSYAAAERAGVCPACSCEYAYADFFLSDESLDLWHRLTAERKQALLVSLRNKCRDHFSLQGTSVVTYSSPADGRLWLIKDDETTIHEDCVGYFAADTIGRNAVFLTKDGYVHSIGDNAFGQCLTEQMSNIRRVLALADCTYCLTQSGKIICCGHPLCPEIETWHNVSDIAAGTFHIVALTTDGRVLVAGELIDPAMVHTISNWSGISKVVVAGDATIGLRADGSIVFAGRDTDPRAECRTWKDVADIAVDSVYAIGLTHTGDILLAGEINDYLDMGRRDARGWKDTVAVFAKGSGIGALSIDGTVHLAGNIRNIDHLRQALADQKENLHADLLSSISAAD